MPMPQLSLVDAITGEYVDFGFEVGDDIGTGKMRWITVGTADQPGTSIHLAPPAADPGITGDQRRSIVEIAGHSDRDDAEPEGQRASLVMAGVRRPARGSLANSVLATVRPSSSSEGKRLELVRRTEVLRNG
jgi:hypothetical protein